MVLNVEKPVRVIPDEQPAIGTGGVRHQVFFSDELALFASNKQMFQSSEMLKVLGTMIVYSVKMDRVGFPYLSPLSYGKSQLLVIGFALRIVVCIGVKFRC